MYTFLIQLPLLGFYFIVPLQKRIKRLISKSNLLLLRYESEITNSRLVCTRRRGGRASGQEQHQYGSRFIVLGDQYGARDVMGNQPGPLVSW